MKAIVDRSSLSRFLVRFHGCCDWLCSEFSFAHLRGDCETEIWAAWRPSSCHKTVLLGELAPYRNGEPPEKSPWWRALSSMEQKRFNLLMAVEVGKEKVCQTKEDATKLSSCIPRTACSTLLLRPVASCLADIGLSWRRDGTSAQNSRRVTVSGPTLSTGNVALNSQCAHSTSTVLAGARKLCAVTRATLCRNSCTLPI